MNTLAHPDTLMTVYVPALGETIIGYTFAELSKAFLDAQEAYGLGASKFGCEFIIKGINGKNRGSEHGGSRDRTTPQNIPDLVGWATPTTQDAANNAGPSQFKRNSLPLNCEVTLGITSTSSPAQTASRGALNPAHSRWLMGFPAEWDCCGAMAMQSVRKRPRSSSKRTSKQGRL